MGLLCEIGLLETPGSRTYDSWGLLASGPQDTSAEVVLGVGLLATPGIMSASDASRNGIGSGTPGDSWRHVCKRHLKIWYWEWDSWRLLASCLQEMPPEMALGVGLLATPGVMSARRM